MFLVCVEKNKSRQAKCGHLEDKTFLVVSLILSPIDGTEGTADASAESNEEEEQSHEDSQTTSM